MRSMAWQARQVMPACASTEAGSRSAPMPPAASSTGSWQPPHQREASAPARSRVSSTARREDGVLDGEVGGGRGRGGGGVRGAGGAGRGSVGRREQRGAAGGGEGEGEAGRAAAEPRAPRAARALAAQVAREQQERRRRERERERGVRE